jgi:hypothetical protein
MYETVLMYLVTQNDMLMIIQYALFDLKGPKTDVALLMPTQVVPRYLFVRQALGPS